MKNGDQPAFPLLDPNGNFWTAGLSKREYFAVMAMQGWIACQEPGFTGDEDNIAEKAVKHADALLKALEKETNQQPPITTT